MMTELYINVDLSRLNLPCLYNLIPCTSTMGYWLSKENETLSSRQLFHTKFVLSSSLALVKWNTSSAKSSFKVSHIPF
jgi:hypothetical protein